MHFLSKRRHFGVSILYLVHIAKGDYLIATILCFNQIKSIDRFLFQEFSYTIGSMYGIFTYIYHKNQLNVGKYAIPWEPKTMKNEGFTPPIYGL